jgi:hypothetical protein
LACCFAGTIYDVTKQNNTEKILILNDPTRNCEDIDLKQNTTTLAGDKKEPIFLQVILSFSFYTNLKKLFTVNNTGEQLDCIHAIRFLSMGW